ncbi:MAG: DUF192 domain-containing protein [Gammaproteobacteria bacterium]
MLQPRSIIKFFHSRAQFVRVILALLTVLGTGFADRVYADSGLAGNSKVEVLFTRADGLSKTLALELASTETQRQRGLMFRRQLSDVDGMVFLYNSPRVAAMWMKNTLIPLDMLFVDVQGRIIYIAEQTEPQSLTPISAGAEVSMVIELAGGNSDRLGLRVGDRVELKSGEAISGSSMLH